MSDPLRLGGDEVTVTPKLAHQSMSLQAGLPQNKRPPEGCNKSDLSSEVTFLAEFISCILLYMD